MERYIIKEKIKDLLRDGNSIEEIRKNYEIDEDIISEFEEEEKIKGQTVKLLEEGKTQEANQLIDSMENEAFRLHLLVKVAENTGDNLERERILRKILEIEPDNVRSMSSLIKILKRKLDKAIINKDKDLQINISSEIKELAERQLKVEPNNIYSYAWIIKSIKIKMKYTNINDLEKIRELRENEKEALNNILRIEPTNVKALANLFKILSEEGNIQEAHKIYERLLDLEVNTIEEIAILIKVVRKVENVEKEKELLNKILQLDNGNRKAMNSLLKIAKEENNKDDRKVILYRILELEPNNTRIITSLLNIAKERNEVEEQKELLRRMLTINPNDEIAKANLMKLLSKEESSETEKIIIEYSDISSIEEAMANEAGNPLEKARRIIYESKDIFTDSEQIKELIEGESELNKNLVLAELYSSTGLQKRAESLLKGYKNELDLKNDKDKVRLINQTLELIKSNKKTKGFKTKWQAFWDQKNEQEKNKSEEENKEFEKASYTDDIEER